MPWSSPQNIYEWARKKERLLKNSSQQKIFEVLNCAKNSKTLTAYSEEAVQILNISAKIFV